jgi:hypothetical protein
MLEYTPPGGQRAFNKNEKYEEENEAKVLEEMEHGIKHGPIQRGLQAFVK